MQQKLVSLKEIFEGIPPPNDEPVESPEIIEEDGLVEFTTREEYIACAYNCLNAVAEVTTMTAEDSKRKNRVTKRCLKIIDTLSLEMYNELFEEDEEE